MTDTLDRSLAGSERGAGQPYAYGRAELEEPEWRRFPGWVDVTAEQWRSAQWQRAHCVKNVAQLRGVLGDLVSDTFYDDLAADVAGAATMSMLLPPQMLNTMASRVDPSGAGSLTDAFYADAVRRYMLPVASDRRTEWTSHPYATRDSLHEHEMWAVEGLTHRYPTKVLAELLPTCPQYCGHCTRMDLVGNSTPTVEKLKFVAKPDDPAGRHAGLPAPHARRTGRRGVRRRRREHALAAAGGVRRRAARDRQRPRHPAGLQGADGPAAALAAGRGPGRAWSGCRPPPAPAASGWRSTPTSTRRSRSPRWSPRPSRAMLEAGVRDVRNQGVLMRGVNDSVEQLLDLCFALLDGAGIMPYYFYMCDMIPAAEHWRLAVWEAQDLQHGIMGYLPGFATPRIVCDVPYVGKRWVHQLALLRPRARHLVLDEELPHRDRDRRRRCTVPGVRVLRPDLHAARRGSAVVAQPRRGVDERLRQPRRARLAPLDRRGAVLVRGGQHDRRTGRHARLGADLGQQQLEGRR